VTAAQVHSQIALVQQQQGIELEHRLHIQSAKGKI
jgi:hypothetical protein